MLTSCESALFPERHWPRLSKVVNGPLFAAQAAALTFRVGAGGIVMAATTPPIVVALAAAVVSRFVGARFIYHNQDIFPENSARAAAGGIGGLLMAAIRKIDSYTGRMSARVVVLSEDMKSLWIDRGLDPDKVVVSNNFAAETFRGRVPREAVRARRVEPGTRGVRIVYIGNIGPLQDLDSSLKALSNSGICEVDVYGDGRSLVPLKGMALDHVHFHGPLPSQKASQRLMDADLGLVSLRSGVERTAYPSKMLTLLESGTPVLAFVNPSSALAREIVDNGLGLVPGDASAAEATRTLTKFANLSGPERQEMSLRCREYSRQFSEEHALGRWRVLFSELSAGVGRVT